MLPQPRAAALPTCGYEGNSDVYGLGIRVGIYLQWVSGLLSKAFLNEEALRDVLNENAIFLLAIFLATVLLVTDTISGVRSVDILIMLHIFFGSIYTVFVDSHILNRIEYFSSLMGIVFKSGVATGMAAIGVWFWFYDVHPPTDPTCSQYAFLFGRVGFFSKGTIMAFKAFSMINLACCATALLGTIIIRIEVWNYQAYLVSKPSPSEDTKLGTRNASIAVKIRRWILSGSTPAKINYWEQYDALQTQVIRERHARLLKRTGDSPNNVCHKFIKYLSNLADRCVQGMILSQQTSPDISTMVKNSSLGKKYPQIMSIFSVLYLPPPQSVPKDEKVRKDLIVTIVEQAIMLGANFAVLLYSIISIELLIKHNAITGGYTLLSTGQIIPFIIGIASLWKVVWQIVIALVEHGFASLQHLENADAEARGTGDTAGKGQCKENIGENTEPAIASGTVDTLSIHTI